MEVLKVNKTFNNYKEMEDYANEMSEKYIVCLIVHGENEYSIDEIVHFGKRK